MVDEKPENSADVHPAYLGPYNPDNGTCAAGHPVNGYGRCEPLNRNPPECE